MQTVKNLVYKNENPYPFHTGLWSFNQRLRAYWLKIVLKMFRYCSFKSNIVVASKHLRSTAHKPEKSDPDRNSKASLILTDFDTISYATTHESSHFVSVGLTSALLSEYTALSFSSISY